MVLIIEVMLFLVVSSIIIISGSGYINSTIGSCMKNGSTSLTDPDVTWKSHFKNCHTELHISGCLILNRFDNADLRKKDELSNMSPDLNKTHILKWGIKQNLGTEWIFDVPKNYSLLEVWKLFWPFSETYWNVYKGHDFWCSLSGYLLCRHNFLDGW